MDSALWGSGSIISSTSFDSSLLGLYCGSFSLPFKSTESF